MQQHDPIVSLSVPHDSSAMNENYPTALAFLGTQTSATVETVSNDALSDDDDRSIEFACETLLPRDNLSGYLASGHGNGAAWLWNVHQRTVVRPLLTEDTAGGSKSSVLALEPLDDDKILLQRRNGGVCVVDVESGRRVVTHQPLSSTSFCAVATSRGGGSHLLAVPTAQHHEVYLIDWRTSHRAPCHVVSLACSKSNDMVTSLALQVMGHPILMCGMESGELHCCDVRGGTEKNSSSSVTLGREPILSLDCIASESSTKLMILAGLAGNEEDLADQESSQRGRVVVATYDAREAAIHLQARICTTTAATTDQPNYHYKSNRAGVAVCRFRRREGRFVFGVGGWDHRLRLYSDHDTATCQYQPIAILRGHTDSITAMAWDNSHGLLATGGADGQLLLWNAATM